jgi:hypothetical protein
MMRRRDFITLLGGTVAGWPLAGRAQQPALAVVAVLGTELPEASADRLRVFREALAEAGYVDSSWAMAATRPPSPRSRWPCGFAPEPRSPSRSS